MKKRDASVQLLRIVACLIVVFVHIKFSNQTPSGWSYGRTLTSCLTADGVSIFWLITGFFYMRNKSFGKLMKRGLIKIALPATLIMIFCIVFSGFLMGQTTIEEALSSFQLSDLLSILKAFIVGDPSTIMPHCGHLWYVFTYIVVLLWFPLLKRFDTDDKSIRAQKFVLMAITFIYIIIDTLNDRFTFLNIANDGYYKIIPAAVFYVLLGDEIYRHIDKIKGNWIVRIGGLAVYLGANVLRAFDQLDLYNTIGIDSVIYWYDAYGVICSVGITVFFLSFNIKEGAFANTVTWIAQFTFPIYLIHNILTCTLSYYPDSIKYVIYNYFGKENSSSIGYALYLLLYGLFIFVSSLIISIIITYLIRLIKYVIKKISSLLRT